MRCAVYIAIVIAFVLSLSGAVRAQTCRRSGAAASGGSRSSGSRAVSAPACGSGTTILGTTGRSGRVSVQGDDAVHTWKGGTYKHPKAKYRR